MILEVSELAAGYGRIPILGGVSFSVARGEFVGILGHNGMGKTTLLRALMGYLPAPQGGSCWKMTSPERSLRRARWHGVCAAGRDIFPGLSVRDNLRMGAVGDQGEDAAIGSARKLPRLKPLIDRPGGALRRRAAAAGSPAAWRAIRAILLDEPTEGIQPSIIDEIAETLLGLRSGPDDDPCRQNRLHRHTLRAVLIIGRRRRAFREPGELHGPVNEFIGVSD
jgi:ABC-type branched-subunit amino acid transport system ATPase component